MINATADSSDVGKRQPNRSCPSQADHWFYVYVVLFGGPLSACRYVDAYGHTNWPVMAGRAVRKVAGSARLYAPWLRNRASACGFSVRSEVMALWRKHRADFVCRSSSLSVRQRPTHGTPIQSGQRCDCAWRNRSKFNDAHTAHSHTC